MTDPQKQAMNRLRKHAEKIVNDTDLATPGQKILIQLLLRKRKVPPHTRGEILVLFPTLTKYQAHVFINAMKEMPLR